MKTTAKIFGKDVETAGITTTQMERVIALGTELDTLSGGGTAKELLRDQFGLASRKGLTEPQAEEYAATLIVRITEAKAAERIARKRTGPYKITRADFRGGHRYDVFQNDEAIAEALPGITTALNVMDKPALLPWIARLTGDAFKGELRRVLIDEAMPDVAAVRAALLPLLNVDGYRMANDVKAKAGDRGTDTHAIAEIVARRFAVGESIDDEALALILRAQPALAAPDVYACALAVRDWFLRYRPTVLGAESMVACLHCACAATLDLHCVIDDPMYGGEWVLDAKTSKGVYESHALQTAFQAHALMQMKRGLHERHCAVYRRLRIGALWINAEAKNGAEIIEFENTQSTLGAVQEVIDLYRWKRSNSWKRRPSSFPRNAAEVAKSTAIVRERNDESAHERRLAMGHGSDFDDRQSLRDAGRGHLVR